MRHQSEARLTRPFSPLARLLGMLKSNGGVDARRLPMLVAYLARYSLLEPLRLFERARIDDAVRRHNLDHHPLFILGYWRCGTTYLQGLLRLDPNLATSTLFRSLFSDVFYSTESWLKPALNVVCKALRLQYGIQRSALDWDLPAETDVALCSSFSPHSYTWGHVFPKAFRKWGQRLIWRPDAQAVDAWLEDQDYYLRKLSLANGGKRLVIKSPGDTARVAHLARKYPQARFVYIHRDPIAVFHSNRYLWSVIQREVSLNGISEEQCTDLIIESYKQILSAYLEQRASIPASQLIEIRYEALRDNPADTLRQIYRTLDLGEVPHQALSTFVKSNATYKPQRYPLDPALEARLREEWAFALDAWPSVANPVNSVNAVAVRSA